MLDLQPTGFYLDNRLDRGLPANCHAVLVRRGLGLFQLARRRGALVRAWRVLAGKSNILLDLSLLPPGQVLGRHYAGIQAVDIGRICGSMGRAADFDLGFRPRSDRLRDRWVSVAVARIQYIPLPAVCLVQVGGCYFVEDGHHRISVAAALGETALDAEVTVWDVRGPLPWEAQTVGHPAVRYVAAPG